MLFPVIAAAGYSAVVRFGKISGILRGFYWKVKSVRERKWYCVCFL